MNSKDLKILMNKLKNVKQFSICKFQVRAAIADMLLKQINLITIEAYGVLSKVP